MTDTIPLSSDIDHRPGFSARDPRSTADTSSGLEQLEPKRNRTKGVRHYYELVPRSVRRLYGPAVLFILWSMISYGNLVDGRSFPPPHQVFVAAFELAETGELWGHLLTSLGRVAYGLVIGTVSGVLLALISGLSRTAEDFVDPIMQVFKAVPNYALIPLLILWFGIGELPKITLIVLSTSMPIYINTYGAIRNIDRRLIEAGQVLQLSAVGQVRHVILAGTLPGFLVGMRFATTSAWLALVFAETLNARNGLGALLTNAREWYRIDIMMVVILCYAVLGLLSYSGVRYLERKLLAWRPTFSGNDTE